MVSHESSEVLDHEIDRAKFFLDHDICYSLEENSRATLIKLLQACGVTMQVINSTLSKINLSLLQNNEIQLSGNKIHELKPDTGARRWIYLSSAFMLSFFLLFLLDYYYIKTERFVLMILGLLIQILLIYKNGKITKKKRDKGLSHDAVKLELVKKHMENILPSMNQRLAQWKLKFVICTEANYIELLKFG
ncbi:hypothetical protein SteCoe_21191 [Stentor coeruleus]|uniref:Uncharacterized protein n=1 Tax=Stentor coeruleus TaxID=5963 RepID=A0A1R2BQ12_9CILI|nr:hypothetical protein SteCoe_21191 [Stentor coeruleus]